MIIGTFVYDNETDSFSGDISTPHFQFSPVEVKPLEKKHERGPDYRLLFETAHGNVELGSAWKRTSASTGREYLSVELDGPCLVQPLNVNMTLPESGTASSMYWNRRKPEPANASGTAPKASKVRPKAKAA